MRSSGRCGEQCYCGIQIGFFWPIVSFSLEDYSRIMHCERLPRCSYREYILDPAESQISHCGFQSALAAWSGMETVTQQPIEGYAVKRWDVAISTMYYSLLFCGGIFTARLGMVVGLDMTWVVKEGGDQCVCVEVAYGEMWHGESFERGKKSGKKKKSSEKVQEPTVRINSHSSE